MKVSVLERRLQSLVDSFGRDEVLAALTRLRPNEPGKPRSEKPRSINGNPKRKEMRSAKIAKAFLTESKRRLDIADLLTTLGELYESGKFLPQLWDVKRFLERYGVGSVPRSRESGANHVVRVLSSLPRSQLDELISRTIEFYGVSDLEIIAKAISGSYEQRRPASQ